MSKNTKPTPYTESSLNHFFRRFSTLVSYIVGSPHAFTFAVLVIVTWALTGPIFKFSDTWQLVINTGTTIITFLMVFLIQNTQNRDAKALHLKLDELIRATKNARNSMVNIEEEDDNQLAQLQEEFKQFKDHYAERLTTIEKLHKAHHPDSPLQDRE